MKAYIERVIAEDGQVLLSLRLPGESDPVPLVVDIQFASAFEAEQFAAKIRTAL